MRLNMTSRILESVQESNEDTSTISYKVLKEEASFEGNSCPRCGKAIIGYPAISRFDNKTEICSDCGVDEALENMVGFITNPLTGEKVSLEELKSLRAAENTEEEIVEEVTIDNEEDKNNVEDRIGELKIAIDDEALSEDEKEEVEQEISDLEASLKEGATFEESRDNLATLFNNAWSEAKFLQAEMRFAKPNIEQLRESITIICDNLDSLGELLKEIDEGGNK